MRWLYTPRDALWIGCQRIAYQKLVRRAAALAVGLRDSAWLETALDTLELTHLDFQADVESLRAANPSARMRGEWPKIEGPREDVIQDRPGVVIIHR